MGGTLAGIKMGRMWEPRRRHRKLNDLLDRYRFLLFSVVHLELYSDNLILVVF